MADFELCWLSALELGRMIRARKISPREITGVFLDAIRIFNPNLNAVVTVCEEQAMAAADKVEKQLRIGDSPGAPLAGVPFLAKDLDITAGVRTTFGSLMHRDYVPGWDMFHIARLKQAGCVLLGKTNTPEDGIFPNSLNDVFGASRNPWRMDRCVGGSSGGSGAAVVAGLAPLATGSDGAGSIRIPASINGCFGFKPTFGMIPFGPKGIGITNSIGHLGPMTRDVRDAAAMLDIMAGGDERDRTSLPKTASFLAALEDPLAPRRVAFSPDLGYAQVDEEVRALFYSAVRDLERSGWPLVEAEPELQDPQDAIAVCIAFEWGSVPMLLEEQNPEAFALQSGEIRELVEARRRLTLQDLWEANVVRKQLCVSMGAFFEEYDLLLTPALSRTAFEFDRPWPRKRDQPEEEDRSFNNMLYPFNLTGDPACSIPIGLTSEGLPVGLQIVGPRHRDARVLRAALAYERFSGLVGKRPPHGVRIE